MSCCSYAHLAFDHAAYHALYPAAFRHSVYLLRIMKAAAFHKLYIQYVRSPLFEQNKAIMGRKQSLICHNGGFNIAGNIFQSFYINSLYRLLHQLNIKALILHSPYGFYSFLRCPSLVGIKP
ncbi:hypothetical protein SDC9_102218 [bioreactor metagenome]|uniref:Uncharacterized protein n=1 Tax=bioreactor metagenome TaxID=1076179 RepID=A0A645ASX6_9ZZZZ